MKEKQFFQLLPSEVCHSWLVYCVSYDVFLSPDVLPDSTLALNRVWGPTYRDGLSEAAFWCDLTVDTTEVDGRHSPNPTLGLWKWFLKNILPQNLWQDLNRWSASVTTIQCISASRRFLTDGQFSVCSSWISCWEAFSVSLTVESPTLLSNNMPIPIICLYKLQNV